MTHETDETREAGSWRTLVRGLALSPEFREGLGVTILLALLATAGKVVVPIAVQLTIDRGLLAEGGPRADVVVGYTLGAFVTVLVTLGASRATNLRLVRATETALSALRVRAFRHIHDLSLAHHEAEHRGSLTARVTADVDTISRFMQWGGTLLIVNIGQLLVATVVMAVYSLPLTAVVLLTTAPLVFVLRAFQRRLSVAYDAVRTKVGATLAAVSESVMGATVIRAYAIEDRTRAKVGRAIDEQFSTGYGAARTAAFMYCSGEIFAALAVAGAIGLGVVIGSGGGITPGELVAFTFLINLFVAPVQVTTEVLDQAQTAIAGWRRILGVLDIPAEVADPAERPDGGAELPPGPIAIHCEQASFAYPLRGQPDAKGVPVLHDVTVHIAAQSRIAVVGETGSGKTTFAKLLSRLADPTDGRILVNGVPLRDVRFASLRKRVVMVPQDDFLFDTTIEENVRLGHDGAGRADIRLAFTELGLSDWLESLPDGLATQVGERGEHLSVGERQLVALTRAYLANPDLLILDEATSAVDPATEVRLQRALEGLTRGRTALSIAHRLSTAEAADEVIVFDNGRIVQRGSHADLVDAPGVYQRLHQSWKSASDGGLDGGFDGEISPYPVEIHH